MFDPNLQSLRYLTALVREEHFGRAAVACGVSQPTLSAGIKRLEHELGFAVVRRGRRYEGLTAEGLRVHAGALRVLAEVEGLGHDVAAMGGALGGRLRLGAIPTSLSSVSLVTTPLCATHTDVTVHVQSLTSREIERGLHAFDLDAGVTYLDSEPLTGVRTVRLYRERYVLLTHADGPLGGDDTARWSDAAELPLVLLSEDMQNRRIVEGIFRDVGATVAPGIETNSISTLFAHVRDGRWSSVMAHAWLRLFAIPPELRALPLVAPEAERSIGLVWLDRDPEPLLVRALHRTARTLELDAVLAGLARVNRSTISARATRGAGRREGGSSRRAPRR